MMLFLETIFAFPVVIYTTLLLLCIVFWLFGAIDIFQLDSLDISPEGDAGSLNALGGILLKFKLHEIPFTVVATFVSLFAWLTSYLIFRTIQMPMKEITLLYYGVGLANVLASGIVGLVVTSIFFRPFNKWLSKLNKAVTHKDILGEVVVIRSSLVNAEKGEAIYEDGGAGMILQVRCLNENNQLTRGSEAIIIKYDSAN
ncbi:MAG: hypothetical protein ACRCXK_13025, partial [Wohlfahrtiimonas sp.]